MARQVNHLSDIPDTRKFGSKYGGRKFKRYNWSWGHGAKSRLKSQGKRLKRQDRISNYRLKSYENVAETIGELQDQDMFGFAQRRQRLLNVLFGSKNPEAYR